MDNNLNEKKPELELRELELKVRELELKIRDVERPSYKKISFWTSLITVCVAIIGIIGQSFLSSIRNAQAQLETEKANKEMQEALFKKANVEKEIKRSSDSILFLQSKRDTIQKNLNEVIIAYNKVVNQVAYANTEVSNTNNSDKITKNLVTETSNTVSNVLLKNASSLLLKSSVLKVYYTSTTREKAIEINNILTSNGVKSEYTLPSYDISKGKNEIVYYSEPQLNYCKAVQALLQQSGLGNFGIRLSSGANSTINHFKIYVVK